MRVEILEVAGPKGYPVAKEVDDLGTVMVMGDPPAKRWPKTLRGIGLWVIRRGRDQPELVAVSLQRLPDDLGPLRCVDLGVVEQDDRHPSACLGALDEVIELGDEGLGGAPRREAPGAPAVAPVDGGKADRLEADPKSSHQALAGPALPGPEPGQGRVMAYVDLVLHVEVGSRQEGKQIGDIGRNLAPQIRLDQAVDVEAQSRCGC
jgi:hypothetical protein